MVPLIGRVTEGGAIFRSMTGRRLRLALAVFALGTSAAGDAHACEPMAMPYARATGSVLLLATAGAPLSPATRAPIGTRRADVLDGRAGADPIARGPAVFVPWAHRADCVAVPWRTDQAPWSPPTSPGVYTAVPRARANWIGGVRTFDLFVASREPVWKTGGVGWYGVSGLPPSMTPAEFLTFYAAFPTSQEMEAKSPLIERRIAAWEAAHRAEAAREPAVTMLSMLRRMLR
jgi:hypothetical protein